MRLARPLPLMPQTPGGLHGDYVVVNRNVCDRLSHNARAGSPHQVDIKQQGSAALFRAERNNAAAFRPGMLRSSEPWSKANCA